MVTKSKYIPFLYVLIGFQLICHECECTNSSAHSSLETIASIEAAPSTTTMASINDTDAVGSLPMEARRLPDESIESITSYSNLLDVSTELLTNEHITPPTAYGGNYHQHSPVHHIVALHIPKPLTTPSFQMPYASTQIPSGNRVRLVQTNTAPVWSPTTALSSFERQPMASLPSHELISLENQYMDSFRNIKSSVMNMIYKVQDFMSYVMSLFTMGKFLFFFFARSGVLAAIEPFVLCVCVCENGSFKSMWRFTRVHVRRIAVICSMKLNEHGLIWHHFWPNSEIDAKSPNNIHR